MGSPYETAFLPGGLVRVWDVFLQRWIVTDLPEDRVLASLPGEEREAVLVWCGAKLKGVKPWIR